MIRRNYNKEYLFILVIMVAGYLVFSPGLHGIFLLDDHANLPQLKSVQGIGDWENILAYTMGGISSFLGRPISLFTFAIQSDSWNQDNPFNFKLANLFIHLINGCMIYFLVKRILLLNHHRPQAAQNYSLLIFTAWLLHPLQVSTVLYVVQRMTELSAFFTLAGMLMYLRGRTIIAPLEWKTAHFYMTAGMGVGLLLGILSKENAILICLYIAALEWTVLSSTPRPRYWKPWATFCLAIPIIALIIYLIPNVIKYWGGLYPTRNFGPETRLLTETRIVVDYIINIILPRPSYFGLFHSDYSISKDLLHPISTLISSLVLSLLLTTAIIKRKNLPLFSFGILLFFFSHILESTLINLELYFEHRNYLALLGILIAIVSIYIHIKDKLLTDHHLTGGIFLKAGISFWCLFLIIITYNETKLWGNPVLQAASWAEQQPLSYRAQGHYAETLTKIGAYEAAKNLLEKNTNSFKNAAPHALLWLNLGCYSDKITLPTETLLENKLKSSTYTNASLRIIEEIIAFKEKGKCVSVPVELPLKLLNILQENEHYQTGKSKASIYILIARLHAANNNWPLAVQAYSSAYNITPRLDILLSVLEIHMQQKNRQWYIETMNLINQYCPQHPLQCIPYQNEIRIHNETVRKLD